MSYAHLSEHLDAEGRKDLDYALEHDPAKPAARQKGVGALMGMMGQAARTGREIPRPRGR